MIIFAVICFYFVVVFLKIYWGIRGDNLGLFADGLDSVKNLATLLTAAIFSKVSLKGVDDTHHFGHTKYDSFGAVIIAISQLFFSGITITFVLLKFGQVPAESSVRDSLISFLFMIFVVLGMYFSLRTYKSESIRAEFWHEFSDLVQTGFVLLSTYVSVKYFSLVNSVLALLIALFLLFNGVRTIWRVEKFIMDWAPPPYVMSAIEKVVSNYKNVYLRENKSLMSSEKKVRVELTIQVEGDMLLSEAHNFSHIIEDNVRKKLKEIGFEVENIVIHFEPSGAHR